MLYKIESVDREGNGWYVIQIIIRPTFSDINETHTREDLRKLWDDEAHLKIMAHRLIDPLPGSLHVLDFAYDVSDHFPKLDIFVSPHEQIAWDKHETSNKEEAIEFLKDLVDEVSCDPEVRSRSIWEPESELVLTESS